MWGAIVGSALSLFGANKQQKHNEKMANQAAHLNQQTVNEMLGDMQMARGQSRMGYEAYRGFAKDYADWAQEEPWRIAEDVQAARDAYTQYGETALNSITDAKAEREGFGRDALGKISAAEGLILKDQEKARQLNDAKIQASGLTGSAAAGQSAQLQAMQADQLESAALGAGREAADITTSMGQDLMGLDLKAAGMEMGMGEYLGQMGMNEAAMLQGARQGGAAANLMVGQTFLDERAAQAANFEKQSAMRMGVQHTAAAAPDYASSYGALGQAIGGIDWGSMFGPSKAQAAAGMGASMNLGANIAKSFMPGF